MNDMSVLQYTHTHSRTHTYTHTRTSKNALSHNQQLFLVCYSKQKQTLSTDKLNMALLHINRQVKHSPASHITQYKQQYPIQSCTYIVIPSWESTMVNPMDCTTYRYTPLYTYPPAPHTHGVLSVRCLKRSLCLGWFHRLAGLPTTLGIKNDSHSNKTPGYMHDHRLSITPVLPLLVVVWFSSPPLAWSRELSDASVWGAAPLACGYQVQ